MNVVEEGKRCSGDDDDLGKELCISILASWWEMCPVSFLKLSNSHANSYKDLISVGSRRFLFISTLLYWASLWKTHRQGAFKFKQ